MGQLAVFVYLVSMVTAYPRFQDDIPNGRSVPNPCDSSGTWGGVGHILVGGGGARNQFGLDFLKAGRVSKDHMKKTRPQNSFS